MRDGRSGPLPLKSVPLRTDGRPGSAALGLGVAPPRGPGRSAARIVAAPRRAVHLPAVAAWAHDRLPQAAPADEEPPRRVRRRVPPPEARLGRRGAADSSRVCRFAASGPRSLALQREAPSTYRRLSQAYRNQPQGNQPHGGHPGQDRHPDSCGSRPPFTPRQPAPQKAAKSATKKVSSSSTAVPAEGVGRLERPLAPAQQAESRAQRGRLMPTRKRRPWAWTHRQGAFPAAAVKSWPGSVNSPPGRLTSAARLRRYAYPVCAAIAVVPFWRADPGPFSRALKRVTPERDVAI